MKKWKVEAQLNTPEWWNETQETMQDLFREFLLQCSEDGGELVSLEVEEV